MVYLGRALTDLRPAPSSPLQYDGGPFAGWAEQPGQRTVAAEVVKALEIVLRQPVDLTAVD